MNRSENFTFWEEEKVQVLGSTWNDAGLEMACKWIMMHAGLCVIIFGHAIIYGKWCLKWHNSAAL